MITTNKLFTAQVQNHIIESLSTDETEELSEQLENVLRDFRAYYGPHEQKRHWNIFEAFKDFLMALPSSLTVEFTDYNIHLTLKQWFENCGEEYKEPKDEPQLYLHLVSREFDKLCRKHVGYGLSETV